MDAAACSCVLDEPCSHFYFARLRCHNPAVEAINVVVIQRQTATLEAAEMPKRKGSQVEGRKTGNGCHPGLKTQEKTHSLRKLRLRVEVGPWPPGLSNRVSCLGHHVSKAGTTEVGQQSNQQTEGMNMRGCAYWARAGLSWGLSRLSLKGDPLQEPPGQGLTAL